MRTRLLIGAGAFLAGCVGLLAEPVSLFDGKTLEGWEGDTEKVWRVEDGVIVGGSMEGNPRNEFLTTAKSYGDFVLTFDYKLVGTEGFLNGGVQIRSKRMKNPPNEMWGYQADIGKGYTGYLYDESRRKKFLAEADKDLIKKLEKEGEWNSYKVVAKGRKIELYINGTKTVDYEEQQGGIEDAGLIGLQIHGNCKGVISFRNIMIEEFSRPAAVGPVETLEELVKVVKESPEGTTIEVGEGTFRLTESLVLKAGMTLKGQGWKKTVLTNAEAWAPSTESLPDPEMKTEGMDTSAYLIRMAAKAEGITVSGMSLKGVGMHGAIYGFGNKRVHLHHLRIQNFLWSGVRTFSMKHSKINDCVFIDAGGRWERGGQPGVKGGITGGAIFSIWMGDTEIAHNRFMRTKEAPEREFYGIKGRQGRRCRIHHNTIDSGGFSIEFPFENDEDMEIDHNICHGPISIPKHAGGPVPESGRTFRIHHNYMTSGYAIEFVRNGVEIDHNVFDFDRMKDGGNLISGFGKAPAKGGAVFHNNLVRHPGRGVMWINEPYNNLVVRNNHIVVRTTKTPRTEGLFGFNPKSDFSTIRIEDNIIVCFGLPRPMMRNEESYGATIRNNKMLNVKDAGEKYENPKGEKEPGPEKPLDFRCGVHGEFEVKGWEFNPVAPTVE